MSTAFRPVPLVGRGSGLRFLGGLLERVPGGGWGGRRAGGGGVGKSALLSEAARSRARRLTNPIHAGGTNPITAMQGQTDEAPTKRLTQTALR
jgi:hypothetical protein